MKQQKKEKTFSMTCLITNAPEDVSSSVARKAQSCPDIKGYQRKRYFHEIVDVFVAVLVLVSERDHHLFISQYCKVV